jgi:hypothetical protein
MAAKKPANAAIQAIFIRPHLQGTPFWPPSFEPQQTAPCGNFRLDIPAIT